MSGFPADGPAEAKFNQSEMNKNKSLLLIAPYVTAVLVFTLICFFFFKPQYEGLVLRQHDMAQVEGMSNDIKDHEEKYGEHPQWTGNLFGGMPSYLINFNYEGRLLGKVVSPFFFLDYPASFIFVAMLGFFLMLRCFGVNPWLGIIGGIAYGLSTYFIILVEVGHVTKLLALAYAAPWVGSIYLAYRKNRWLGVALTGVFTSLELGANHIQMTYYFLLVIFALFINEGIRAYREKIMKRFAVTTLLLVFAGLVAIGSNAILLWYVSRHSGETMRGGSELAESAGAEKNKGLDIEYATHWSYGKTETFDLFIPGLMGGSSTGGFKDDGPVAESLAPYGARHYSGYLPGYWGSQPMTDGPVYIGAVMIFLFTLGMYLLCGRNKWWIFAVTVLSILLAWGHNLMWFTRLFFDYFPLYNKFRTVSSVLVIAQWTIPLVALLVLQKIWKGGIPADRFKKGFKYSLILTGGIALFFALFGPSLLSFTGPGDAAIKANFPPDVLAAMVQERIGMLRADSLRTLVYVLLTAGTVLLFYREKLRRWWFVSALSLLVLADMAGVDRRFLNRDSFVLKQEAKLTEATDADRMILADPEPGFRVANFTVNIFNDASTSYFHRSVGGYHAAKLSRYQDLIARHLSNMNWSVYNMLNTKYIIQPDEDGRPVALVNPDALGAAWFAEELRYVSGAQEEIDALDAIDPAVTAVVDERFRETVGSIPFTAPDSTDYIRLSEYYPNRLVYDYRASGERLAVFSEIYYPNGWTATVDGQEVPHFRADYVLRAMLLPAGEHTVEFRYMAPDFPLLRGITLGCSILLLGGLAAVVAVQLVKRKKEIAPNCEKR